jgi:hypothetical protein
MAISNGSTMYMLKIILYILPFKVDIRSKSTLRLELFLFGQKLFVENNPKYHALCIVYHTICIRNKISILNE